MDARVEQSDAPKLLAEMSDHINGVNVVRWSPDGKLLASAGLDRTVILYGLDAGGIPSSFGMSAPTVESWRQRGVLRGHHEGLASF